MASDWIKMRVDLFTHPKVVRIASALKADNLRTVGGLMSAWCLFDTHSIDGRLEGYTIEALDDHLRWPGFATAMIAVEWLDADDEGLELPRFDTHNGASAKRRAQDADRKRAARKASASKADKVRTREEKRREEVTGTDTPPPPPAGAPADRVGAFEGHERPTSTPNPCAPHAIALNRAGVQVTTLNPDLIAFVKEGGTPGQLVELAQQDEFAGKKATYIIRAARRMLAEQAPPPPAGTTPAGSSKTATGLAVLEGMKSGRMAERRDLGRAAAADLPLLGPAAGD